MSHAQLLSTEPPSFSSPFTINVLVGAANTEQAQTAVKAVGGTVTHQLSIINSVAADLTAAQIDQLRTIDGLTLDSNRSVNVKNESTLVRRQYKLQSNTDDAEQAASGAIELWSSALELGYDEATASHKLVGLRFSQIDIPPGSRIVRATLQVDADQVRYNEARLSIAGEAADNAAPFTQQSHNLSSRTRTEARLEWTEPAWMHTWRAKRTLPDVSEIVQEIVDRNGWTSGSDLAFLIEGHSPGGRIAKAREAGQGSFSLMVEYLPAGDSAQVFEGRVSRASDDAEEGLGNHIVVVSSEDLDFGETSDVGQGDSMVGLRIEDVNIPPGAILHSAELEFQVEKLDSTWTSLVVMGQDSDDAKTFMPLSGDISMRPYTEAVTYWQPESFTERGQIVFTPDISGVVDEILKRDGWQTGNDMAFFIYGVGNRSVQAFGADKQAATLRVVYSLPEGTNAGTNPESIAPGECGSAPYGESHIMVVGSDLLAPSLYQLFVRHGAPNAPLYLDGEKIGCLDDHGDWWGQLYDRYFETCRVEVSDTVGTTTTDITSCVSWRDTHYPTQIGADALHEQEILGDDVTVAFVDTGIQARRDWGNNAYNMLAHFDSIENQPVSHFWTYDGDRSGHGSHVASVAASKGRTSSGQYNGIAPHAQDRDGARLRPERPGYVCRRDSRHRVDRRKEGRVQHPGAQPLVQRTTPLALLAGSSQQGQSWRPGDQGIVVVASAGNEGPDPMTDRRAR